MTSDTPNQSNNSSSSKPTIQVESVYSLETAFAKVPLEQSRRLFRQLQRHCDKDWVACLAPLSTLKEDTAVNVIRETCDSVIQRLTVLKRKMESNDQAVAEHIQRTRLRLSHLDEVSVMEQHLSNIATSNSNTSTIYALREQWLHWQSQRLDRRLVDYLMREGCIQTARLLAETSQIHPFTDISLFHQMDDIINSLVKQHRCQEALAWCAEHKMALRKQKSTLEFQLRVQEYIECVRQGRLRDALVYAKRFVAPWSREGHLRDVERALGLLAFRPNSQCEPYHSLFSLRRWQDLADLFRADTLQLHGLSPHAPLLYELAAGLSALKTPHCGSVETRGTPASQRCPVCMEPFTTLAAPLPCSHHIHSSIVCRVSGKLMDADNGPEVLPNGRVYSHEVLQQQMERSEMEGTVRDPITNEVFPSASIKKAFVL